MEWTEENGLLLIPLGLGWLAVWWLMPSVKQRPRILGGLAGLAAILMLQMMLLPPAGDAVRNGLFFLFAAAAVISAVLMITDRNPVYSALWFALVTLAVDPNSDLPHLTPAGRMPKTQPGPQTKT